MPVKKHNNNQLKQIPGQLITISAKDEVPTNSKISDVTETQNRKQSETGGLASLLAKNMEIKENEVKTIFRIRRQECWKNQNEWKRYHS